MTVDLAAFDPQPIVDALPGLETGQRLGIGGQKAVWPCVYQEQRYVLKVLLADAGTTERAKRELEVYRLCTSPFLPRVGPLPLANLQIGPDPTQDVVLYYLEEYIDGLTLQQTIKPMPTQDVVSMARCLTDGIENLWGNGFVHRDIKPANIMRRTNSQEFVLLDAGLALSASGPSLTNVGGIVGTEGYLSPDQLQMNKRDLDFRSDLFALGICMYECLTNQRPFWNPDMPQGNINYNTIQCTCPPPQRWNANLPAELCELVMRLLEKERHLRYSKFQHLREDLNRIVIP